MIFRNTLEPLNLLLLTIIAKISKSNQIMKNHDHLLKEIIFFRKTVRISKMSYQSNYNFMHVILNPILIYRGILVILHYTSCKIISFTLPFIGGILYTQCCKTNQFNIITFILLQVFHFNSYIFIFLNQTQQVCLCIKVCLISIFFFLLLFFLILKD